MGKQKLKKPLIKNIQENNKVSIDDALQDYATQKPLFSFEYLCEDFINNTFDSKKHPNVFKDFVVRLHKLGKLGWNEIHTTQRHGFGTEKIPIEQIKPDLPPCVTPDINKLVVFRADGSNHVFAGFMRHNVFFVLFIESNFGDLYDHD